ncbi:MAG: DUF3617 family protein [Usitatibacter sp.]
MRKNLVLAAAFAAAFSAAAIAGPFDAFKGKMKDGMYDYKMEMDMGAVPGMPPGMGKTSRNFQHCVTQKDLEQGGVGSDKGGKMPEGCEIKDFKMSGNTATYTMECKGERAMKADNRITFSGDGFTMDMKMAMNAGGKPMNMTQHMEGKYVGPCK